MLKVHAGSLLVSVGPVALIPVVLAVGHRPISEAMPYRGADPETPSNSVLLCPTFVL